jgi:uncharacterized protein (DUF1810 family)
MVAVVNDPFDLERFVNAQGPVYGRVCGELRNGWKSSHWMWFIFPQLRGLGSSATAERFGISSRAEAEAYLAHPILGPRLRECTRLVHQIEGRSVEQIFGYPDDLKFRSSMTLFANVTSDNLVFINTLKKYFAGEHDSRTLKML